MSEQKTFVKAVDVLRVSGNELGKGLVICMTDRTFPIDANNYNFEIKSAENVEN